MDGWIQLAFGLKLSHSLIEVNMRLQGLRGPKKTTHDAES